MQKTTTKIFGIVVKETTVYEDEKEMPIANESGQGEGVVIELSQKEIDKMEKQNREI